MVLLLRVIFPRGFFHPVLNTDNKLIDILDESKFAITYLQVHKFFSEKAEIKKLVFHFYDDREDIFEKLIRVFFSVKNKEGNTMLLPEKAEISLFHYDGKAAPVLKNTIIGGGQVDRNYAKNIQFLFKNIDCSTGGVDFSEHLIAGQNLLQKFQRQRLSPDVEKDGSSILRVPVIGNIVNRFLKPTPTEDEIISMYQNVVRSSTDEYLKFYENAIFPRLPGLILTMGARHGGAGYIRAIELKIKFRLVDEEQSPIFLSKVFFTPSNQTRHRALYDEITNPKEGALTKIQCKELIISFFTSSQNEDSKSGYNKHSLRSILLNEIINQKLLYEDLFSEKIRNVLDKMENNMQNEIFKKDNKGRVEIISPEVLLVLENDMKNAAKGKGKDNERTNFLGVRH